MGGRALALGCLILALLPGVANAHGQQLPPVFTAMTPDGCTGRAIEPDVVKTGSFGTDLQGSYVMVPFDVPSGTTAVRVKYCYSQPEAPTSARFRNTLDLGLYEPRSDSSRTWGVPEFRGWGGSSHPDVTVSPEGFSSEADYAANPRREVAGKTTRAFRPGPMEPGEWAVELGVAAVTPPEQGNLGGDVAYRVEIELSSDPAFADEPYTPAPYDRRPARRGPGWYAGDLHVHAEHSAYGDATMREAFDYAFGSLDEGKAGLDFITLSDYVSGSGWGEIGRYQGNYPGKLVARSAEVITYRGHLNNHGSAKVVDYREGPIYERRGGATRLARGVQPARSIFDQIRAAGGYTQVNHPTIFPSAVPGFGSFCRGCEWSYSDAETDYSKVDGIEVATGPAGLRAPLEPGPNPFTLTAIQFYEDALDTGNKIAAVGVSDSHNAGRTPSESGLGVTQAPIGEGTTVVFADELSEAGVKRGVEAGHTYVKVAGNDRPDLRFEARVAGRGGPPAIMGDTVRGDDVGFEARVLGGGPGGSPAGPYTLLVMKDRLEPVASALVSDDDFTLRFRARERGRYRLQLMRGTAIEGVSSPIYVEAARGDGDGDGDGGGAGERGSDPDGRGRTEDRAPGGGDVDRLPASDPAGDGSGGGSLPFTGFLLATLLGLGVSLAGLGLALRRRAGTG